MRIGRGGQRTRDAVLRITWLRRSPEGPARLGLAVSRRAGNAVARNRIKRVIREAFRLQPDLFPDGIDLVVSPANAAAARDLGRVARSLVHLAHRIEKRLDGEDASAAPSRRPRSAPQ